MSDEYEYLYEWLNNFFYTYKNARLKDFERIIKECLKKGESKNYSLLKMNNETKTKYMLSINLEKKE